MHLNWSRVKRVARSAGEVAIAIRKWLSMASAALRFFQALHDLIG